MLRNLRPNYLLSLFVLALFNLQICSATPSDNPDVTVRRGKVLKGTGDVAPTLELTEPTGGWTSQYMLNVAGSCSDQTADPIVININGVRYYVRTEAGSFSRKFPAARGKNNVTVECANSKGVARVSRTIDGVMAPSKLKIVLTSDTDGVYTDLHIYEPDGHHVYWADTNSPTGGLFFLNQQGDSYDQPGYGPYLYVHPAPPLGVIRVDVNYWPGGAIQHTLASLDLVTDEGLPTEARRRVRKPLARPGETQTLAYIVNRPNNQGFAVYVPGQDKPENMPAEVALYQKEIEPKIKASPENSEENYAYLTPKEESDVRQAVTTVALQQAKRVSPGWNPDQRDCAGLVRFAFKEALEARSDQQRKNEGWSNALYVPTVGERVRRLLPAYPKFWETGFDKKGELSYGSFADAETLLGFNFRLKGRDLKYATQGDILAFQKSVESQDPYHLMLFAGPDSRHGVVVYHTGTAQEAVALPIAARANPKVPQIRVVSTKELFNSPDATWIPDEQNGHFLGVFEWKKFRPKDQELDAASSVL